MTDINNRKELRRLLLALAPDTIPLWGKMTPQQMVEHLIVQVQYTNGKKVPTCDNTPEEAYRRKKAMLSSNAEFPKNIVLGPLPEHLMYENLETAVNQLITELEDFDVYFREPGTTVIHGGFGPMDYAEWQIWHG